MSTILTIHSKLHPLKENAAVNTNKPTICSDVLKKSITEKNSTLLVKLNFVYALRQNYLPSEELLDIQTKLMNNNNMRRFGKSMQWGNH